MISGFKAVFCLIMAAVIMFSAQGCGYSLENSPQGIKWRPSEINESELNANKSVLMQTEQSMYPPGVKNIVAVIANNTSETLDYGAAYALERKQDEKWYSANMDDIAWIMIAYILSPGETQTHEINFEVLEGTLTDGEYRIIKSIGGGLYSAGFFVAAAE